jgi:flagellar protein FlgJ
MPLSNPDAPNLNSPTTNVPSESKALNVNNGSVSIFQNRMAQHAAVASQSSGVPVQLMLGQAALESGWGKHAIKSPDGTDSHNLFGIKAGANWSGKVVMANTTEYINGVKQNRIEKFRAYDSYTDSFKDFAQLISTSPRYKKVMDNLHNVNNYAQAMQQSGYATDPNYARKLASAISKVASS